VVPDSDCLTRPRTRAAVAGPHLGLAGPAAPGAGPAGPAPRGPEAVLVAVGAVLAAVAVTVGLGVAGWVAGVAVGVVTRTLLRRGLLRSGAVRLGPANAVTLARAALVAGVTALAVESLGRAVPGAVVVGLTGVALALDAVDGQVARRTGTATPLGARFDMEVDAFLILVLSLLLVRPVGPWVLAIGGMRYGFVAAARLLPWLATPLPPRYSRKIVAAVQGVVLVAAVSGVLPPMVATVAVAGALAALGWSFGVDVRWLAGRGWGCP
jgi:phosphatidylglycerophosphate synthase